MRRTTLLLIFLLSFSGVTLLNAQNEAQSDTLATSTEPPGGFSILPSTVKSYGSFLLDMKTIVLPERYSLDNFNLVIPDASKDYSFLFRPNTDVIYTQGNYPIFSPYHGFGLNSFWGTPSTLQMGSFRLKNGWRLNTYGEYNADGKKVYNPSALPWERNNFKGAFELKSEDGSFGIRFEVQRGREFPFH